MVDEQAPVGFRAWDGSAAGGKELEATVDARSPAALWYLLSAPSELGLARAYVSGALDVDGDLHTALAGMERHRRRLAPDEIVRLLAGLRWRELRRAPVPPEEAPPRWRRGLMNHTRGRDAVAIHHHYDLSNRFYRVVLGPSMAYSCAVFTAPDATLEAAQEEKFDLICRKL
ncbi:MAG TPA: class I SAM-dependent methyltransferase, partial [Solirubrobacteraceae bacterium]